MSTTPTPPADPDPRPEGAGTESVIDLHRPHMAQMNDPVMTTVDGTPSGEDEEPDSVRGLLDMLAREQAEPRDGFEPVPFWVALIFGGLLAWGGYYMGTNTADYRRDVFDRSDLTTPESAPPVPRPSIRPSASPATRPAARASPRRASRPSRTRSGSSASRPRPTASRASCCTA